MAPFPAALVARTVALAEPRWSPEGRRIGWVEAFAGRSDLVLAAADGSAPPVVVTAAEPLAGVGSYGGGVWCWASGSEVVYAAADGRLLAAPIHGGPVRVLSRDGRAVAPTAWPGGTIGFGLERDDACDIASVPLDGSAWPERVSDGADFAWDPAGSPDGESLAWHEWDMPAMSWDASRIVVDGRTVAGGEGIAVGQPRFSPDGSRLAYVSDATGWWNVWIADARGGRARPLLDEPHDHAEPSWGPGQRSFAWSPDGSAIALQRNEAGFGRLVVVNVGGRRRARELSKGWHYGLDWGSGGIVCVRSGARTPPQVTVLDPDDGARSVLARGAPAGVETDAVEPEAVTWRSSNAPVHGLLYRPEHSALGDGAKPPLLVDVHGGPTGQATVRWDGYVAWFVARGWAVLRPDYRGSTGYGRAYREALSGRWGERDVADTAAGIRAAARHGWCEPGRVAIAGGSAGGLTALLVCAHHGELVRAGVSAYGVTDLFDLAETTHRFESRYLDALVGDLPRDAARFRDRSPVTHAAAIRVPLLVLQGDADKVVPPAQAQMLVDAVRAADGTVEHYVYAGEGHGWSRPETVQDELERTLGFLERWVLRR